MSIDFSTTKALPILPLEIRYPLPENERAAEAALLAATGAHFANFAGSQREAYNALIAQAPTAPGVWFEAVSDGEISGWWASIDRTPKGRAVLFVHGGAYMLGSAKAYCAFVSQIVARTGVSAFILDYPLAPEHAFPAAYDATIAARRWLRTQGIEQLALFGDSAGGALILASLSVRDIEGPAVIAAVAFSPWTDLTLSGASFTSPDTYDPIFQPEILRGAAALYLAGADPSDGRASPLLAIPQNLPPLAIQVGSHELLLDDARRYASAAAATGSEVRIEIYEDLHHVFQRTTDVLPSAARALDSVADFVAAFWL